MRDSARFDGWAIIDGDALLERTFEEFVLSTHRPTLPPPSEMAVPGTAPADIDEAFLRGTGHSAVCLLPARPHCHPA